MECLPRPIQKSSPPLGNLQRERKTDKFSVEPDRLLKVVHCQVGLEQAEDRSGITQLFHLGLLKALAR